MAGKKFAFLKERVALFCLLASCCVLSSGPSALADQLSYARAIEAACARIVEPNRPAFFERTEVLCYAARNDCSQWSGALLQRANGDGRCAIKVFRRRGRITAALRWYLGRGGDVLKSDRFCFRPDGSLVARKTAVTLQERVRINIRAHFDAKGEQLARSEHHFDADTGEAVKRKTYAQIPDLPILQTTRDVWRAMLVASIRDEDTIGRQGEDNVAGSLSSQTARRLVERRANRVLELLKAENFAGLAGYVHPENGVRFSPEAFVDQDRDLVLSPEEVATLGTQYSRHVWSVAGDNSDIVVETDFKSYYRRFIYDHDFVHAPQYGYNCSIGQGNTIDNARSVYPQAVIAEFHFPGIDTRSWGYDWSSLRLAFSLYDGDWYLVGIIHDHWTL